MTRRYTHNVRGELVADTVRFGSTVLRVVCHERDALGRVTGTTESVGASSVAWRYHYDASGALDSVWRNGALSSWWGYDSNGVRVSGRGVSGVTHDAADRVLSQNGVSFTYDSNGRLVSRRAGASETRYVYDLRGGLRAVDLPSGDRIAYGVDASGRRISRSVNGVVTHHWLWEGNLRPVGEVDSTGRVLARYVYGTRANVPDAIVRHDTLYRVITDERGSVRMVVNASTGEVASSLAYDAWGNVTESVHGEFQPFGFGGGLRDDATGLVRMGARDYAPELGRWTATDPIGFEGGDANLYGYVGNDPVNYVDPTGLVPCETESNEPSKLLNNVGQMLVGFGDGASFNLTKDIRDSWQPYSDMGSENVDLDSPYYNGGWGGGVVASAAISMGASAEVAIGWRTKVALHGPHHTFWSLGRLPHLQVNSWFAGVKNSQSAFRFPLPKWIKW